MWPASATTPWRCTGSSTSSRPAHPGLEIESCASGGARVDLGILARTDRIWTSDTLDPLERLVNQRYTALVVPPEMMGMHLTSPVVHSTGRTVDLDLSAAVALLGHVGIEWDLTATDEPTRSAHPAWVEYATSIRPLVATGRTVDVDGTEPGIDVRGVVARTGSSAVFTLTQTDTTVAYPPGGSGSPGSTPDGGTGSASSAASPTPASPRSRGGRPTPRSPVASSTRSGSAHPSSSPSDPPSSSS